HNDCSPDNTLISPDGARLGGIIDFGDVTVTALVNDLAIAVANMLGEGPDPFGPGLDLIAGYHAVTPLTAAELSLLPDLILGRVVARIIISEWRAERFPENRAYVLRNTPGAREHLHRLLSIPGEQTAARIQEATRACHRDHGQRLRHELRRRPRPRAAPDRQTTGQPARPGLQAVLC